MSGYFLIFLMENLLQNHFSSTEINDFQGKGGGVLDCTLSNCLIKRVKDPFDLDADPDPGHEKFF